MNQHENSRNEEHYKLACAALAVLMVATTALGALGLVWMRQGNSRIAGEIKKLESEIAMVQRDNRYLESKIAELHSPERLRRHVTHKLSAPAAEQVVWIGPAGRTSRPVPQPLDQPFAVSFDLALLDNPSTR